MFKLVNLVILFLPGLSLKVVMIFESLPDFANSILGGPHLVGKFLTVRQKYWSWYRTANLQPIYGGSQERRKTVNPPTGETEFLANELLR